MLFFGDVILPRRTHNTWLTACPILCLAPSIKFLGAIFDHVVIIFWWRALVASLPMRVVFKVQVPIPTKIEIFSFESWGALGVLEKGAVTDHVFVCLTIAASSPAFEVFFVFA
jgi:hypothetical protein